MQIRSDWMTNQPMINDVVFSPKEGETVFATLKEKLSNNEAIVTIKGQDVHVRFQGDIPAEDKFAVRIAAIKDDVLEVQVMSQSLMQTASESSAKTFPVSEAEKAEQILLAQGIRLSKEDRAVLRRFFEKTKGTLNEKLETIQALVNKKLEFTEPHLAALHEALHGEPFAAVLTELAVELEPFFAENVLQETAPQTASEHQLYDEPKEHTNPILTDEQANIQEDGGLRKSPAPLEQQTELPYWNDEWFAGVLPQTKDIIVKTVTEKLSQAAIDFKKLQTEMNRKLENAKFLLDSGQPLAHKQAKQFIEAVINTLDRAILQGEFMLFTDMKTEKQLLQASAKLAEAKQLIAGGKQSEALKIVNDVKSMMEGLRFQPADVKVKHFVSEFRFNLQEPTPKQQFLSQMTGVLKPSFNEELSARNTLEQFRQLGLHHEKDFARAFVLKQPTAESQNIKALLMKLSQGETGIVAQQAEQALANLTGQQLLSKYDANNHMQTMFYQLPLLMQDKIETVNIYLNSRNDGGKLDWENCSMYFLFDTEKHGKVGILLQALERNLTLTIKTDNEKLTEALKPLTEIAKDNLETIGYNVKTIAFTKMSEQQELKTAANSVAAKNINDEKGYDFTV